MSGSQGRSWRLLALLTVAALFFATCGDDEETTSDTATDDQQEQPAADRGNVNGELVIGTLLPQTGDLAQLGPPMVKGAELAVQEINAAGGVNGKPVRLVQTDDGGTSNNDLAAASADRLLTTEKVDAVVGAAGSSSTKAVIDKITGAGAVECSPSNTSAEFTTIDSNGGYYFRTAPPDNLQGPVLADVITGDGKSKVAIMALNDPYGQGLAKAVREQVRKSGADVVAEVAYDPKGTSFDADVQKVADAKPDAVALLAFPDTGGRILASMTQKGIGPRNVSVYVADGMQSKTLYQRVDPNNPASTQGIKGTAPSAAPTNGAPGFSERFQAFAPGTDTIYSSHSYDCVTIIALAAQKAKSDDPAKIRDAMFEITREGDACTSFQQCKGLVDQGRTVDYEGASGLIEFRKTDKDGGEPSIGQYDVFTFQADGTYTTDPRKVESKET